MCECDGWYKYRKGWSKSHSATSILKTFLGEEQNHRKKIQVQGTASENETVFRPQLTFLSLLAKEDAISDNLTTLELLEPTGKIKPPLHVPWAQALVQTREMLDLRGDRHFCTVFHVDLDQDGLALIMKRKKDDDMYFRIRHEPAWDVADTPGNPVYVLMRGSEGQPEKNLKPLVKSSFTGECCPCCEGKLRLGEEAL